jgi:starch synthase
VLNSPIGVPVYFVKMDHYYDREYLYSTPLGDYKDNNERFVFFCKAVLEFVKDGDLLPDIIHCHDWQTALIPVYLKTIYHPFFQHTRSLLTIHNLAYQGLFWHWDMPLIGLGWEHFNWRELEFYGKINFLKGGIVYADLVTTVSKRYAQEIQTPEFGCGLDSLLRYHQHKLHGVTNGVDYTLWSPGSDKFIVKRYAPEELSAKASCKSFLQKRCGLEDSPQTPLIGMIGRLAEQKGIDLVVQAIDEIMKEDLQLVMLGVGEERYHRLLKEIQAEYPQRVCVNITFDEELAHQIIAGSDMLLMPSRFEPCGLLQLYSMKYGTVPVVRQTGGLADTVVDCTEESLKNGLATGFTFKEYSPEGLLKAIKRALWLFKDKNSWQILQRICMKQDWSWQRSADEYIKLYKKLLPDETAG